MGNLYSNAVAEKGTSLPVRKITRYKIYNLRIKLRMCK